MDNKERWEVRLGNIRVGACGCDNCVASQELIQFIAEVVKETEISRIKMTLSRINLNESNAYPIVDESESLKDVKEALCLARICISPKKHSI